MGTPSFAVPTLDALAQAPDHEVVAVFSRPDSKSRRGNKLFPLQVKARALELGIPVYTPLTLRDNEVIRMITEFEPDAIVVAAYGGILPGDIIDIPKLGCYNVHGSLLPRWRGAAPIQRAILDGDDIAGVCIMQVEEGLDTGDYHTVGSVEVGAKTTDELTDQIARMGAEGMLEALNQIEDGTYTWEQQDEDLVTYAEKVSKDETLLRPGLTSREFLRRVQASSHRAPARCVICGKTVAVIAAHPADDVLEQGQVVIEKKRVLLGVKGRAIELDRVKPESKREMEARQWAAGLRADELVWNVLPEYYHKLPVYG
jgi:methionyl-tRNA formyltransferase